MNKTIALKKLGIVIMSIAVLSACSANDTENTAANSATAETVSSNEAAAVATAELPVKAEFEEEDLAADWSAENATAIDLGSQEETVTITAAGTYVLSGKLKDGGIIVNVSAEDKVRLVLNNADITNSNGPAIDIKEGEKVFVTLAEGTQNSATDGIAYSDTSEEAPTAAIYSKADLVVNGAGSLVVKGQYKDGITSRDDLKLVSGTIEVQAADDAIVGRDLLAVRDGVITVEAGGDGLKSTNDSEEGKGNIAIEGGTFAINAVNDGLQAAVSLRTDGGTFDIVTGGGSANAPVRTNEEPWGRTPRDAAAQGADPQAAAAAEATEATDAAAGTETESTSAKALKAASVLAVTGGTFTIDSADDALHSNNSLIISGGDLSIQSGDDGAHADASLTIEGGTVDIVKSYEGIEGTLITIAGGDITVAATDDGVNVSGGNDTSSGGFGQDQFADSGDRKLVISGGTINVNAAGDGLDANGSIEMSGGTVTVFGPTNAGNGTLDYDGTFNLSGGTLIASGSAGMAMAPSEDSAQATVAMSFSQTQTAGSPVTLKDADGTEILTVTPTKDYQIVLFSSPEVKSGSTYSVASGDTQIVQFETDGSVTWVGESGVTEAPAGHGGMGGGMGGGGMRPGGGQMPNGERPARPGMEQPTAAEQAQ
ncbi:carbohydrate-binding domain-containing protein [Paenibacillus nanensis]|uniref:Carbohydrate-binding domain-containing protein n=1 Tax=Paenibacillus nanensis TaxID=393251 RepID=A0A3A1V017_9BACL|nr:carbohydrate-binding domain-containing protein [Paenibacillus nanensis]RIX52792.1 carbohydrate-binding domain-containing protein [Paenibacillus nanensis]